MPAREHRPLSQWFGEKKIVRLMLLAALLTLGVIHIGSVIGSLIGVIPKSPFLPS